MEDSKSYEYFMKFAYDQALLALERDEVPVGCVIICGTEVVGAGFNMRNSSKNVLAHAEIIAINQACRNMGDWRLEGCTLYATVEPCPMCAGAILQARLDRVVFGADNKKAGCAGSVLDLLAYPGFNHRVAVTPGIMQEQCSNLMQGYFYNKRNV